VARKFPDETGIDRRLRRSGSVNGALTQTGDQAMKAMFANLTSADFRRPSRKERRAAERRHVHALFDEIQIAIYNGDRTAVDYLMGELAIAGQRRERTLTNG
jgi:hypothetical protein